MRKVNDSSKDTPNVTFSNVSLGLNNDFITFCATQNFKNYVKEAINDELFWRDIFGKYSLENTIDSTLQAKMRKIREEIKTTIDDQISHFATYSVPGLVSKSLNDQISIFLLNNAQMQNMLHIHLDKTKEQIKITAHDIMDKISNEDKYHTMMIKSGESLDNRINDIIRIEEMRFNSKLIEMQNHFNNYLNEINTNIASKIKHIDNLEITVSEHQKDINELKRNITVLQKNDEINRSLIRIFGMCIIVIPSLYTYYLIKK